MTKFKYYLICISIYITLIGCNNQVIYNNTHLIENEWIVEQDENGKTTFYDNKIDIADASGYTVWFKHKLEAPITIEYDATVIEKNGPLDRVSDLNCFWMANDPESPNKFFKNSVNRKGVFKNYHNLTLYYVGLGGHNNTKTRFRKYDGNPDRPLLKEHDLSNPDYLITANQKNHITLTVKKNYVSYKRNDQVIFEMKDTTPYSNGYFGIRGWKNHVVIENLKISK